MPCAAGPVQTIWPFLLNFPPDGLAVVDAVCMVSGRGHHKCGTAQAPLTAAAPSHRFPACTPPRLLRRRCTLVGRGSARMAAPTMPPLRAAPGTSECTMGKRGRRKGLGAGSVPCVASTGTASKVAATAPGPCNCSRLAALPALQPLARGRLGACAVACVVGGHRQHGRPTRHWRQVGPGLEQCPGANPELLRPVDAWTWAVVWMHPAGVNCLAC